MIPEPIWEAVKWVIVISCFGIWIKHFVEYILEDPEETEEKEQIVLKGKVRKYVDRILDRP